MKPQATRHQPAAPANAPAEVLGVLLCGIAVGAGLALYHAFTWAVFS